MESSSWAIMDTSATARAGGTDARFKGGATIRHFLRTQRPSPLQGRAPLEAELFPSHIWVHEALLNAAEAGLPTGARFLLHEKGRPLCLPQEIVDHLDTYCNAGDAGKVPPHLQMLDLLDGRERLWFVIGTWRSWLQAPRHLGKFAPS